MLPFQWIREISKDFFKLLSKFTQQLEKIFGMILVSLFFQIAFLNADWLEFRGIPAMEEEPKQSIRAARRVLGRSRQDGCRSESPLH